MTGATGRLGGRVARRLAAAGISQRLLVRDPARAPQLPDAQVVRASFIDHDAVRDGLAEVPVVFMVSASEDPDRVAKHVAFTDAAVAAGVRHLVYLSVVSAAADSTFTLARQHHATERYIRSAPLTFTFLRDNFYADFMTAFTGEDDVIRGPGGDGRVAVVALEDVADAVAAVLADPAPHAGATYSLTGPQALSLAEIASVLAAETGRPVSYQPETVGEAYATRARYGAPEWQLDSWVSTYTAIAAGDFADVSDDVARLAGHPATSLAGLLRSGRSAY